MQRHVMSPTSISSRDKFDIDFSEIHENIYPTDIRDSDRIAARVRERTIPESQFEPAKVWRMSPLGVELVCTEANSTLLKSKKIDLELTIAGQVNHFQGLVVDLVKENNHIVLAGVRLSSPRHSTTAEPNSRRSQRWLCSEDFYPTCVSPTPGRFNEYMYFQIRDISRDGFQLLCSLRNKYLIPGSELNLTASFPMVGDLSIPVTVTRIGVRSDREKDYLVVGTEYKHLSKTAKSVIGQYLLQFSNAETLSDLRESGFLPNSVAQGTDYYFLKNEADYEEVLKLRLLAHRKGGTLDDAADLYDMSDRFDSNSRIIIGKHKGRIIASARVHFSSLEEPMEHEGYVKWPSEYPRRDSVLEITRVCTHPEFRSNDLLAGMLKFLGITCFQPQRPWVLVSSTDRMLPFYKKIGLQLTELSYEHPVYQGKQNVLLTNAFDILKGKGVHPIYWNALWRDVYDYHLEAGAIRPEPLDKARIRVFRLLLPLGLLLSNLSRKPRKR
jgi:hypothetical protein